MKGNIHILSFFAAIISCCRFIGEYRDDPGLLAILANENPDVRRKVLADVDRGVSFINPDTGENLLVYAVKLGNIELVKFFLDIGFLLSSKDKDGMTPLHIATDIERWDSLMYREKPKMNNPGRVIQYKLLQLLIKQGADLRARNKLFQTPLICALSSHHPIYQPRYTVVKLLVDSGAGLNDVDSQGWSALHHAVMSDSSDLLGLTPGFFNKKIVVYLVKCGSDMKIKNDLGMTPFDIAKKFGRNCEMLEFLAGQMVNQNLDR